MEGQQPQSPPVVYQVAGEGNEEFTRFQIRDRIRTGEILPDTELAVKGTEAFRAASTFPELSRYFSLASPALAGARAGSFQPPPQAVDPGSIPSVGSHAAESMMYPFTGIGWAVVLIAALANVNPIPALIGGAFTAVYALAIVRKSSAGSTVMPSFADLGGPLTFFADLLKFIGMTLLNLWPVVVALIATYFLRGGVVILMSAALLFFLIYYPASFALLAISRSVKEATTPAKVLGFINVVRPEYAVVLFVLFLGVAVSGVASFFVGRVNTLAGMVVTGFLSNWLGFFVDHLLGWCIYRHRHELMM